MTMLAFARPWWLLALLPLAFLAWRLWRAPHIAQSAWQRVVDAHLLPHLLDDVAPLARRRALEMLIAGMALTVLALAGPLLDRQPEHALRRHALRVLAIDLSPQAAPHIDRIRLKADALLRALPEGETALIVYGEEPYLVVPPTTDTQSVARFIPELAADAMPQQGNRPERAARMASALFERNGATGNQARDLVWIAADAQAAMFAVDGARVSLLLAGEQVDGPRNGGLLLRMQEDDSDVRKLAALLARDGGWIARPAGIGDTDIGAWLLLLILPLAALAFRRGVLAAIVPLCLASLLSPPPANALDLSGYAGSRLLAHGKPEAAAARFSDPQWRAIAHYRAGRYDEAARLLEGIDEPDALYNRGNALAKQQRLVDALAAYEASLKLRPDDADTLHNRDLVRRLLNQRKNSGGRNPAPENQSERDADRLAENWLRGVPDEPQTLLRRKLALEHRQRAEGKTERPW